VKECAIVRMGAVRTFPELLARRCVHTVFA
jgi:hypothetical protein